MKSLEDKKNHLKFSNLELKKKGRRARRSGGLVVDSNRLIADSGYIYMLYEELNIILINFK